MKILESDSAVISPKGEVRYRSKRFENIKLPQDPTCGFFTSRGQDFSINCVHSENGDLLAYVVEPMERSTMAKQVARLLTLSAIAIAVALGMYLAAVLLLVSVAFSYAKNDVVVMFFIQSQLVWWITLCISAGFIGLAPAVVAGYCLYLFMGDRWKS